MGSLSGRSTAPQPAQALPWRVWFAAPVVVTGGVVWAGVGAVVTAAPWAGVSGIVAAVVVLGGLTGWQATWNKRDARAAVWEPLDPPAPAPGSHTLRTLVAPEQALAPLEARTSEKKRLLSWCTQDTEPAVALLGGAGGTGKTRLAVELAHDLARPWVAGRCVPGKAATVLAAVAACGEPTLIVVDDADTEPGVATLAHQALTQPAGRRRVTVLLLVRDAAAFGRWLAEQLPEALAAQLPATVLEPIGGSGDRRR